MTGHAQKSPSSAHRWMECPASIALEAAYDDGGSEFADDGSVTHDLGAQVLNTYQPGAEQFVTAAHFIGTSIEFNGKTYPIDAERAARVQDYVNYIDSILGPNSELLVEQRLSIAHLTGEADASGTADAIVVSGRKITVVDLKDGRGVAVEAQDNPQLLMYALAAYDELSLTREFDEVRCVIVQPKLNSVSEAVYTIQELESFRAEVKAASERVDAAVAYYARHPEMHSKYLNPGDKQCRFCRAKADCKALATKVLTTVGDEFIDLTAPLAPQLEQTSVVTANVDQLGEYMSVVDLVEGWCKAVRAKVERNLLAGTPVTGWKLVQGRKGGRKWADVEEATAMLKTMKLKVEEMYDLTLISPAAAEKLHKSGVIGPRQWPKLQSFITQSEGQPSVAPESDKRPALDVTAKVDEFDAVDPLLA